MAERSLKSCTLVLAFCRQIDTLKRHRKNLSRAVMLKDKQKSFDEIMDVYGFRVIVDSVDTCYQSLPNLQAKVKTTTSNCDNNSPLIFHTVVKERGLNGRGEFENFFENTILED